MGQSSTVDIPGVLALSPSNIGGGASPSDIAMALNPLPANNPIATPLPASTIDALSALNAWYFGTSTSTGSFTDWLNQNSSYIVIGGAFVLALLFFGPSVRRRW
jgi:hypothetical protein